MRWFSFIITKLQLTLFRLDFLQYFNHRMVNLLKKIRKDRYWYDKYCDDEIQFVGFFFFFNSNEELLLARTSFTIELPCVWRRWRFLSTAIYKCYEKTADGMQASPQAFYVRF